MPLILALRSKGLMNDDGYIVPYVWVCVSLVEFIPNDIAILWKMIAFDSTWARPEVATLSTVIVIAPAGRNQAKPSHASSM